MRTRREEKRREEISDKIRGTIRYRRRYGKRRCEVIGESAQRRSEIRRERRQ